MGASFAAAKVKALDVRARKGGVPGRLTDAKVIGVSVAVHGGRDKVEFGPREFGIRKLGGRHRDRRHLACGRGRGDGLTASRAEDADRAIAVRHTDESPRQADHHGTGSPG